MTLFRLLNTIALVSAASAISLDLDERSFHELSAAFEFKFIYFYSPFVEHHANADTEFELLALHFPSTFAHLFSDIAFGRVQCLVEEQLCAELGIRGFPKFVLFSASREPIVYPNARRFRAMQHFIADKMERTLSVVSAADGSEAQLIAKHKFVIIGYQLSAPNIRILEAVQHRHLGDVHFALFENSNSAAAAEHEFEADESLVFFRDGDEWLSMTHSDGANEFSTDSIRKFVAYGALPQIEELSPSNFARWVHGDIALLWLWIDIDDRATNEALFATITDLMAYRRASRLEPFGAVYSDSHRFRTHFDALNLERRQIPQALLLYEGRKFVHSLRHRGDFSFEAMLSFVRSVMDTHSSSRYQFGTRSMAMEPPRDVAFAEMVTLSTEHHDRVAFDAQSAVVVEYYSRWSLRSKHFASDFRKIGEHFQNASDVVVAKFEVVRNDPPFHLSRLPTIAMYLKGRGNQFVLYDGVMHSAPVIAWIEQHRHRQEHFEMRTKLVFN